MQPTTIQLKSILDIKSYLSSERSGKLFYLVPTTNQEGEEIIIAHEASAPEFSYGIGPRLIIKTENVSAFERPDLSQIKINQ